jgi:hypothetical protein
MTITIAFRCPDIFANLLAWQCAQSVHIIAGGSLHQLAVRIVKRSDQAKGFEALPMRWMVERALAWFSIVAVG